MIQNSPNKRRGSHQKMAIRLAAYPVVERVEPRVLMTTVYGITDLGNLGGGNTVVAGINDSGKVVGASDVKSGVQHPFLYANGKMTDLGVPAGFTSATAVAVNAKGDVLILASDPNIQDPSYGPLTDVFLDVGGVTKNLGLLPGFNTVTSAAFNDSDTVVGSCAGPTGGDPNFGQFIYQNNTLSALAAPGAPYAINDAGLIVGHGYIDSGGVITMLQTEGDQALALAVNASGESAGYVPDSYGDGLALFTPTGVLTDVPIPGEATSGTDVFAFGESINNSNVVVGSAQGLPGYSFAGRAIIEQNGVVQDLNSLIDPSLGITLMDAPGINNHGAIVATTSDGRGLLLTPKTETLGTVSGTVFNDANGDGIQQAGESGLAGQTVYLDLNANGQMDPGEPTTVTNAAGHYAFNNLWPGTYTVGNVLPGNAWKQTAPSNNGEHTATLALGQTVTGENFGEQQVVEYTVTDLSSFATDASYYGDAANAINASGQIAGEVAGSQFGGQAVVFSNGTTKLLTASDGEATGINDSGQVVGYFSVGLGVHQTTDAFLFYNGKFTNLGTLKGDISSVATAINNKGEIVGFSTSPTPPSTDPYDFTYPTSRGLIDINGVKTAVDSTSQINLFIYAVNNNGIFVGEENSPGFKGPDTNVPFISVNGKVVDLSSLEGSLNGINNLGQAVGTGDNYISANTFSGGFMYANGKITPLAGLQGANGINDAGIIVGTVASSDGSTTDGAVDIGGKAIDLNNVVPAGGIDISSANAINSSGWIAASGIDANNNTHALLLKPVFATVTGNVFWDKTSSGVYQTGDTPLAGRQVYVDVGYKGHYVAGDPTALTDANGNYTLTNVPTGGCVIRAVLPGGWYQTSPAANAGIYVSAGAGANFKIQAFGEGTPANLTISGEVFNDLNDSGGKNSKDPGIAGVTVYIDANNNGTLDNGEQSFVTGANGSFSFNDLLPGTYVVRAVTPSGFKQTTPLNGGGNTITLTVGRSVNNAYFGETVIKAV